MRAILFFKFADCEPLNGILILFIISFSSFAPLSPYSNFKGMFDITTYFDLNILKEKHQNCRLCFAVCQWGLMHYVEKETELSINLPRQSLNVKHLLRVKPSCVLLFFLNLLRILCEFHETLWTYCLGDNPHYVITFAVNFNRCYNTLAKIKTSRWNFQSRESI